MDKGEVAEKGTPHELILKKGIFAKMVRDAGKNGLMVKEIAELAYKKKYGL
jgi:ABC-type transport system involved in cytochrome bd biosynthesis fused ATPase/permease subunit